MSSSHPKTKEINSVVYEVQRVYATTEAQREIWTTTELTPEATCAYTEAVFVEFNGDLDESALTVAFKCLLSRHEAFRTLLSEDGLEAYVLRSIDIELEKISLAKLSVEEQQESLENIYQQEVLAPFDFCIAPLFRVKLISLGTQRQVLLLTGHHIVCDGWSIAAILEDLGKLYSGFRHGKAAELEKSVAFSRYADVLGNDGDNSSEEYWLQQYQDSIPVFELPLDKKRPRIRSFNGNRYDQQLDAELIKRAKQFGAKHNVSFVTVMLAVFEAYMFRISDNNNELVVGLPSAGQSVKAMDYLVGHCVNLLPLRTELTSEYSFTQFLEQVRKKLLDAYEHQDYTFGRLLQKLEVPRSPDRIPLVPVVFNIDPGMDYIEFDDLELNFGSVAREFETFEWFINIVDSKKGCVIEWQYNSDLFSNESIARRVAGYMHCLEQVLDNPNIQLASIDVVAPAELKQIQQWNATQYDIPHKTVIEGFRASVVQYPERIAVRSGESSWTYQELDERSNQLANYLSGQGISAGDLVGVALDREKELLLTLLALWKLGSAYLPLDPNFPLQRLAFMISDSNAKAIIYDQPSQDVIDQLAPEFPGELIELSSNYLQQHKTLSITPLCEDPGQQLAYVIYTSGSTGKPKGVLLAQHSVVNFLYTMQDTPGIVADDVLVSVTTLSFDIAVLELYLPILSGAQVVIASKDEVADGEALAKLIHHVDATIMQATPATWRMLFASGWQGKANLKALCGGEALVPDLADTLLKNVASLWNMYGPTETTVWSSCCQITNAQQPIRVGQPIGNTEFWILDETGMPAPIGVEGELCIGGDGLALGYHNRPDVTDEKFIQSQLTQYASGLVYRTGDAGRWCEDGTLECLRRIDNQVKVRGYRIELGEIDAVISQLPQIKQAAVLVKEFAPNDVRIVAYCELKNASALTDEVLKEKIKGEITASITQSLPVYMAPQHYVFLPGLPLTPNGKIDRKQLPEPFAVVSAVPAGKVAKQVDVESLTGSEAKIFEICSDVLSRQDFGLTDNFFELGGHSLLATQVAARIRREFHIDFALRHIFESPTVAGMVAHIEASSEALEDLSIPRRDDISVANLSLSQRRLWYLEQLDPGTAVHNLPSAFTLYGALDVRLVEQVFQFMINRHEILRTYLVTEHGQPQQKVLADFVLELELIDLSENSREVAREQAVALMEKRANIPFPLNVAPLFDLALVRISAEEHILYFTPHHLLWDGWSFDILIKEFTTFYADFVAGRTPSLPELPIQYGDYADWIWQWLSSERINPQLEYWLQELSGELPVLELPTDFSRPAASSYEGGNVEFAFSADEIARYENFAQSHQMTLYMLLMAAYNLLLSRYSLQRDIIISTPIAGRIRPEMENLLGFFVNTLVLRLKTEDISSIADYFAYVREKCLQAFANQETPFEKIIELLGRDRNFNDTPLFRCGFTYQDVSERVWSTADIEIEQLHVHGDVAATDLGLWVKVGKNGLLGGMNYSKEIFRESTVENIVQHFKVILNELVERPQQDLFDIPLLSVADEENILAKSVGSVWDLSSTPSFVDQIIQQCNQDAKRTAIRSQGHSQTYGELKTEVDHLACYLQRQSVGRGDVVGVCVERSVNLPSVLLGILKAGAAYLPLDPNFPPDRIAYMLADSNAKFVITDEDNLDFISAALNQESATSRTFAKTLTDVRLEYEKYSSQDIANANVEVSTNQLAYVIYTSGSTGKPKGVRVPLGAATNFLMSMADRPGLSQDDVLLAVTTISFDISVLELFLPLMVGAKLVIASKEESMSGIDLKELLEDWQVSVMQATPTTWQMLIRAGWMGYKTGRVGDFKVLCGGEAMPDDLKRQLLVRATQTWNMYGPTETTVWSTCYLVQDADEKVLVGSAIHNTTLYVLDEQMRLVPDGIEGELYIGGSGVTLGYHQREALTAERFIRDPFLSGGESVLPQSSLLQQFANEANRDLIMYRTGDAVKRLASGEIEYLARVDNQVKVRGFRIELGEIETQFSLHPEVAEAVVAVKAVASDPTIIGYYLSRSGEELNHSDLRSALKAQLPDYMLPQYFIRMDKLPLTPNGKIDRKQLPLPKISENTRQAVKLPETEGEKYLAKVWQQYLSVDRIAATDNFFELGGHSILSVEAIGQIKLDKDILIPVRAFLMESLEQIAYQYLDDIENSNEHSENSIAIEDDLLAAAKSSKKETEKKAGLLRRLFGR